MKTFIKDLSFDTEMVQALKQAAIENGMLYNLLIAGKITMQEYLGAAHVN